MKFRWIATVLILALGLAAGGSTYFCLRKPMPVACAGENASLLWLRMDFNLPADKMARIAQMHGAESQDRYFNSCFAEFSLLHGF